MPAFDFSDTSSSLPRSIAVGSTSLRDVIGASFDLQKYADNSVSQVDAEQEAYTRRRQDVLAATGVDLGDPYRKEWPTQEEIEGINKTRSFGPALVYRRRQFKERLAALSNDFPDQRDIIAANRSPETDAKQIARDAQAQSDRVTAGASGAASLTGGLIGGGGASLRDPLQLYTLALGAGPGAARSVAGRIFATAVKEAAINGAVEAALQPSVQSWRKQAGLDAGFEEALRNVALAAGFGGVFGGALQGAGEAARKFLKGADLDAAAQAAAPLVKAESDLAKVLQGDEGAARKTIEPIVDDLGPEVRGATAAMRADDMVRAQRPDHVPETLHDTNLSRAVQALESDPIIPVRFEPDRQVLNDVVNRQMAAYDNYTPDTDKAISLAQAIANAGGLKPDAELGAIGADAFRTASRNIIIRKDGMDLDRAVEFLAEEGYLGVRIAENGISADAVKPYISDMLDLLTREIQGEPQYRIGETGSTHIDLDGERAFIETRVADVMEEIGPGLTADDLDAAFTRSINDGTSVAEAYANIQREKSLSMNEAFDADDPGFIPDDGLHTGASLNNPIADGLDHPIDDLEPLDLQIDIDIDDPALRDYGIPSETGELVPLGAYMDELQQAEKIEFIIGACRA